MTGYNVQISRGDTTFHVHGDQAGSEGVWLAKGQVEGIWGSGPVKTTWKSSAMEIGSRQVAYKRLHRDLNLGFHVVDTISHTWEYNHATFLAIFNFYPDPWDDTPTTITIGTELGTRSLAVLMYEQPEVNTELDPSMQGHANILMKLRAGEPDWV